MQPEEYHKEEALKEQSNATEMGVCHNEVPSEEIVEMIQRKCEWDDLINKTRQPN